MKTESMNQIYVLMIQNNSNFTSAGNTSIMPKSTECTTKMYHSKNGNLSWQNVHEGM